MQLDLRKPTLVITGTWNAAIFQTGWIAHFLFDIPKNTQIRAHSLITGIPPNQLKEIIYINSTGVSASPSRVEIYANSLSAESVNLSEEIVLRLLRVLLHTPVHDLGVNFCFIESDPTPEFVERFNTTDEIRENYRIVGQELSVKLAVFDGCVLNLKRTTAANHVSLEFNYHFEAIRNHDLEALVRNTIIRCFEHAKELLASIYNIGEEPEFLNHDFDNIQEGVIHAEQD